MNYHLCRTFSIPNYKSLHWSLSIQWHCRHKVILGHMIKWPEVDLKGHFRKRDIIRKIENQGVNYRILSLGSWRHKNARCSKCRNYRKTHSSGVKCWRMRTRLERFKRKRWVFVSRHYLIRFHCGLARGRVTWSELWHAQSFRWPWFYKGQLKIAGLEIIGVVNCEVDGDPVSFSVAD